MYLFPEYRIGEFKKPSDIGSRPQSIGADYQISDSEKLSIAHLCQFGNLQT